MPDSAHPPIRRVIAFVAIILALIAAFFAGGALLRPSQNPPVPSPVASAPASAPAAPATIAATLPALPATLATATPPALIKPGDLWPDNRGQHVQAHGGGILKLADTFYWFGEDRTARSAVACYSSTDLVHWTFLNRVLSVTRPADFPGTGLVVERPKVYVNEKNDKSKRFVMYFHMDSGNYSAAQVGVATSEKVDGPYQFLSTFRPLNHESRDIGQFVDDDGTAYLIFEDRPNGFHIAKLSADFLTVEKDMRLIPMHMEGGALVHYQGLYYAIGSALTGWNPNPNKFATATSLSGPWSAFRDIAPPNTNTYGSQSTLLLKIVGTKTTTVIFMGDMWKQRTLADSRYLWMPLQIGNGQLSLPQPQPWSINLTTGEVTLPSNQ